jgi:hypothetical protein
MPRPALGHWVELQHWPAVQIEKLTLYPGAGQLRIKPGTAGWHELPSAVVGLAFRHWLNVVPAPELLPGDQASDDQRSLTFETEPLGADIDLLGRAQLRCQVRCDQPVAQLAARLCDVSPDSSSALVSWSVLNLTHRSGSVSPQPLEPRVATPIALAFKMRAHRFCKGHRIRLSLSQGLWPLVWPAPRVARLEIDLASTALELPLHVTGPAHVEAGYFGGGHVPPAEPDRATASSGIPSRTIHCRVDGPGPDGRVRVAEEISIRRPTVGEAELTISRDERWELETVAADPSAGYWHGAVQFRLVWPTKVVEVAAEFSLHADEYTFHLVESCRVVEDGIARLERSWHRAIRRTLL